ncbi:MAG TPA: hypothetical protein VIV66_01770 [Pyrinomonadaceae bacterium]
MKSIKQLLFSAVLSLAIVSTAFAGNIPTPSAGNIPTGVCGNIPTGFVDVIVSVIKLVL